jgi:uncharacterized Zn-binding protein involved in type VI secretion
MLPMARKGDRTHGVCSHPSHKSPITIGGTIITSASKSICEGMPLARMGDRVITDCGHEGIIIVGSAKYYVEGMRCACKGDSVDGVYKATIITSSKKTKAP